ncbi:penicillin-binding transpeptidase domain-containing protein [Paenibacillus alba]|uniref:penicillin-binding transpeptidase domain-containing protein n=1 Tax=Paenibacillus alba TaxID=1197127 RepID=UPI0015648890|nr:penicillin-binding transpeptidase domain-containing protein [Paenibacillus alba]NQX65898.1 penicillin-binding transpeptidase domain-containing protein [Paenibacillus alba]
MKLWIVGVLCVFVFLTGCKQEELPEERFQAYLQAWNELRFEDMYDILSEDAKQKIGKETFVKRYRDIYSGIGATNLKVTLLNKQFSESTKGSAPDSFTFQSSMDTQAGPISFTQQVFLVHDKSQKEHPWGVQWNPSLIFPDMKDGDKVLAQSFKAVRGNLIDRKGQGLAINGKVLMLGVVPDQLGPDAEKTKIRLSEALNLSLEDINKKLSASWIKTGYFVPLGRPDVQLLQGLESLPGVSSQEQKMRVYPLGEAAAQLTGYIQQINAEELSKLKVKGYVTGDLLGKAGLEQIYEEQLKGKDGGRIDIADATGKIKRTLAEREAVPGQDIRLTIDADLQLSIYEQMNHDAGAAVALNPSTGEILSLVSSPAYNPNTFISGVSDKQWKQWNDDPKKPLLNRFTKLYAPGSVFKSVTAAAGLNTKVTVPQRVRHIEGLRWTKDASWGNYYVTRVRDVSDESMRDALVNSDNIFFAQEALDMGKEKFEREAQKFGFGEKLPIAYPVDVATLSNSGIKSDVQLADSAYGQGEVLMTPLHVALSYIPFVNKGNLLYPALSEQDKKGNVWREAVTSPENADLIQKDLLEVVQNPKGFGHGTYLPNVPIAGKTGTAELKLKKGEDGQENGWFVGFNTEKPRLLISMMVEDVKGRGGSGLVVAKAKPIFQKYVK